MKKILYFGAAIAVGLFTTGCIEEVNPQSGTVTIDQAANAPHSFENFTGALTSQLSGKNLYGSGASDNPNMFGVSSWFIAFDMLGQDIAPNYSGDWFSAWYECSVGLGPGYAYCQMPWTIYYGWIKDCNTVIKMGGEEPSDMHKTGVGMAYALRAYHYEQLAQMYAPTPYTQDRQALTVPLVTENTEVSQGNDNPRITNEEMWNFIISDLDKAEEYLAGYHPSDKTLPSINVVYGLKARAYLVMGEWANAEKYAKMAMDGYTMLTEEQFLNRNTGFNSDANPSWMWSTKFKSDDECILENDADSSWGSFMILEISHDVSGCGYASNYGQQKCIDYHLYQTIPDTDWRKLCWIDFSVADLDYEEGVKLMEKYSDVPESLYNTPQSSQEDAVYGLGGASVKFRANGGAEGRDNQYIGFCVTLPLMRVEEMKLIEAEAAGMQNEGNGIALLTAFAQTRDPEYTYGTHNEAYGNPNTSKFQNECWWQRRVELWGEGFATWDIKRLGKSIIRSYAGTNHLADYRWNTDATPTWMTLCIGGTDANYNTAIIQNTIPVAPTSDSPEYVW